MTYSTTDPCIGRLRDDLQELRRQNGALEREVQRLRQEHDEHIREVVAARNRREQVRFSCLVMLLAILWAIDLILAVTSPK